MGANANGRLTADATLSAGANLGANACAVASPIAGAHPNANGAANPNAGTDANPGAGNLRALVRTKLASQAGATLLIALAFFIICALVGSAVLAQSAVQLKAVQARQDAQRGQYSVTSAASLIMDNWEGKMVCYDTTYGAAEDTFHGVWQGDSRYGDSPAGTYSDWQVYEFWYAYGPQITAAYEAGEAYEVPYEIQFEVVNGNAGAYRIISGWYEDGTVLPVYGKLSIDEDLCTTIVLYAYKEGTSGQKAYQATLTIPAIPSYDADGKLSGFLYGEPVLTGGGLA